MKKFLFISALLLVGQIRAQHFMTYGSFGKSKYGSESGLSGKGYGFSGGYSKLFAVNIGYDHFSSEKTTVVETGKTVLKIDENYFRYQVGVGLPIGDDKFSFHAALLFGFLSGMDKLSVHHEYPNGMISYGMEKNTGVYKALRSLVPMYSIQGGVLYRRVGISLSIDFIQQKKKDLFEFQDGNFTKYSYVAVYGGTGTEYRGLNDLHGFKVNLGLIFYLGKEA